jgi:hypothetical protein
MNDQANSIKYFLKSLDMYRRLKAGDDLEVANALFVVGLAYNQALDYKNELKYKLEAYEMYKRLNIGVFDI